MQTIYVNAIGNYTQLTKEDLIQNTPAYQWIDGKEIQNSIFLDVSIGDTKYKVHHSQVQIVTTVNSVKEQRFAFE